LSGNEEEEELHQSSQRRLIRRNTNTRIEYPSTNLETVINNEPGMSFTAARIVCQKVHLHLRMRSIGGFIAGCKNADDEQQSY
jgi:hypothetical protein